LTTWVLKLSRIIALGALLLRTEPAWAEGGGEQAEKLFREGAAALKGGELERACSLLAQSNAIDPAIGTLGLLALCHERQGRIATAVLEYRSAALLARAANQTERAEVGTARADELAPQVSHLELSLPDQPHDMSVTVGGRLLSATELTMPLPLDPGPIMVQIAAVGFESRSETAIIAPGGATTQLLVAELTPLAAESPTPKSAPPIFLASGPPNGHQRAIPASAQGPAVDADNGASTARWLTMGTGVLGLGAGGLFGVLALSSNAQARSHCTGNECDATGVARRSTALREATASTIAFAVGAVAVGASVVLFLGSAHRPARVVTDVRATPGGGVLWVRGAF
jgi:hypothetical protein